MIATTVWNVGGNTDDNILYTSVKNAYQNEIVNPIENITYSDEIGLMYVSDYGYAAAPSNWTTELNNYESATSTNWLYLGSEEWTISRRTDDGYDAFTVDDAGSVGSSGVAFTYAVCPSFYLESNVVLTGGTGNSSDPYRLDINK